MAKIRVSVARRGRSVFLVCLLILGCALMACAGKPKEAQTPADSAIVKNPHFHAAFDGTRAATVDGRKTAPLNQAKYEYEDGPVGQAIVIDKVAVVYQEENTFPLKQGTLMFWLKPHWQPRAGKHHWPFKKWTGWKGSGPLDGVWFLFGGGGRLTAGLSPTSGSGSALHWFYEPEWKQGQWKHVAVTWGKEGAHYYINGCLMDTTNHHRCFPEKHAGKFHLGGKHNYYSGKMSMDDLRIYSEPLSGKQVKAFFALGNVKFVTAPPTMHRDGWVIRPPAKFARLPKDVYAAWPAHTYRIFTGKTKVVEDKESETGIANKTELTDQALAGLDGNALKWDMHDHTIKATGKEPTIKYLKRDEIAPGTGYHWYKLGTYCITENNFIWMYGINLDIELGDAHDPINPTGKYDIWARVKFNGPAFSRDAKSWKNAISIEWVVAVNVGKN